MLKRTKFLAVLLVLLPLSAHPQSPDVLKKTLNSRGAQLARDAKAKVGTDGKRVYREFVRLIANELSGSGQGRWLEK